MFHGSVYQGLSTLTGALWVNNTTIIQGGGIVTRWNDLDLLHQDLTSTNPGNEPVYVASGINGLPCVLMASDVTAVDNGIGITTNLLRATATEFTQGDPRYIFCVFQPVSWAHGISSGVGGGICQFRGTAGVVMKIEAYNWNNDGKFHCYATNGGIDRTATTQASYLGVPQLYEWAYDGTNIAVYRNGVQLTLDATTANPADTSIVSGFYLGRNPVNQFGAVGEALFGEFRVFPGIPTANQLALFRAYLVGKWAIP